MTHARGIPGAAPSGKALQLGAVLAAVAGAAAEQEAEDAKPETETTDGTFTPPQPRVNGREITVNANLRGPGRA